jgi:hypothetical protein
MILSSSWMGISKQFSMNLFPRTFLVTLKTSLAQTLTSRIECMLPYTSLFIPRYRVPSLQSCQEHEADSTSTLTSTIPAVTTVVLVPLTMTSTARSTQLLTSTATTTVTSYTGTQTLTSTIVVPTTAALVPLATAVQTTQVLTSTGTITATGYTTTTATIYTGTQTVTSTSVVYATATQSGAGAVASSPLAYLALLSLFAIPVGRVTVRKSGRILRVRPLMGRRCLRS